MHRRFIQPLLWGITGLLVAVLGNVIVSDCVVRWPLLAAWHPVRHVDELMTAGAFALMRWIHGEWKFKLEQTLMSRANEQGIKDALMILRYSTDDGKREKALAAVIATLSARTHDDFHDGFGGSI